VQLASDPSRFDNPLGPLGSVASGYAPVQTGYRRRYGPGIPPSFLDVENSVDFPPEPSNFLPFFLPVIHLSEYLFYNNSLYFTSYIHEYEI
jgi:hypothetical protein